MLTRREVQKRRAVINEALKRPPDYQIPLLYVSVIIVTFNSSHRIEQAIEKVGEMLNHLSNEVIVVDNASSDDTAVRAQRAIKSGRTLVNRGNRGYAAAANQGLAIARGRTCLLLNDDASLMPDAIDLLMSALESDPNVALVGTRTTNEDGTPTWAAAATFPGPLELLGRFGRGFKGPNLYIENSELDSGGPVDVAWVDGACALGDTSLLRAVGGFNTEFFVYGGDLDLCRRLKTLGYRVVTVPEAGAVHVGGRSTSTVWSRQQRDQRRREAIEIYYRLWHNRMLRGLIHTRKALGISDQPRRFRYHFPKAFYDGPSLRHSRFPAPITPHEEPTL